MKLSRTEQILLELLKGALSGKLSESAFRLPLTDEEWNAVRSLAIKQGVYSIAFDGVELLPPELQPSKKIALEWAVNVKLQEERYNYQCQKVKELKEWFEQHNLKMMVMKGLDLASFYPIPSHREWGDCDIWLFGHKEEGDRLAEEELGEKVTENGLHSKFYFDGMPVENHAHFADINSADSVIEGIYADFKHIDERISSMAEREDNTLILNDGTELCVPTPTFSFIFFSCHMIRHFSVDSVFRHLLDWACFLKTNGDNYDKEFVRKTFGGLHVALPLEVFTRLAIRLFDLSENCDPNVNVAHYNKRLEDKVLEQTFNRLLSIPRPQSRFLRVFWRAAYFFHDYWLNKMLFNQNAFQQISYYFHRNKFKHIFS